MWHNHVKVVTYRMVVQVVLLMLVLGLKLYEDEVWILCYTMAAATDRLLPWFNYISIFSSLPMSIIFMFNYLYVYMSVSFLYWLPNIFLYISIFFFWMTIFCRSVLSCYSGWIHLSSFFCQFRASPYIIFTLVIWVSLSRSVS